MNGCKWGCGEQRVRAEDEATIARIYCRNKIYSENRSSFRAQVFDNWPPSVYTTLEGCEISGQ